MTVVYTCNIKTECKSLVKTGCRRFQSQQGKYFVTALSLLKTWVSDLTWKPKIRTALDPVFFFLVVVSLDKRLGLYSPRLALVKPMRYINM